MVLSLLPLFPMPTAKFSGLIQQLGTSASDIAGETDGELLTRFLATRDEPAFAELVRRYGAMVFAVCRRVTSDVHLAEDAFQAVFVVLATRAASIRPASALPAWLHSVATRTALRARTVADRRRKRETTVESLPETHSQTSTTSESADIAGIVDEEIARLPETLRAAVVLCELEGYSRKAAAEHLGVPEGTVSSRLAAARKSLADRLRNRGVMLNTATLAVLLGSRATASVPASLAARAVSSALSPELLPAAVSALSTGVLRVMLVHKLKTVGVVAILTLGVAVCTAWASSSPQEEPPAPVRKPAPAFVFTPVAAPEPKPAPKPLPKFVNKLTFWHNGNIVVADLDGKITKEFTSEKNRDYFVGSGKLSPDGTMFAAILSDPIDPKKPEPADLKIKLHVGKSDEKQPTIDLELECESMVWSRDSTEIACTKLRTQPDSDNAEFVNTIVNVKTKAKTVLKMPEHVISDWSRDGKYLVTTRHVFPDKKPPQAMIYLMNRDGTEHKKLTDDSVASTQPVMSPDGKSLLYTRRMYQKRPEKADVKNPEELMHPVWELAIIDIATGKSTLVAGTPVKADLFSHCWSPDGKQIAYIWRERHDGKPEDNEKKVTASHVVVCDTNGKNAKTIFTEKGKGQRVQTLGAIDWR